MEANRLEMPLMISDIVARGGVESVSLTDGSYDGTLFTRSTTRSFWEWSTRQKERVVDVPI